MKNMKKKNIIVTVLLAVLAVSLVSAAVLNYYGRVFTTVEVEQSIELMGPEGWMTCAPGYEDCTMSDEVWEAAPGGERFCFKHQMRNRMSIEGTVNFETFYSPDGEGIDTAYLDIPATTTLVLENKDSEWAVIEDAIQATLTYDTVNPTFDYGLEVTGLAAETEYVLIYYADADPRFDSWGGDNPGALVATFTTDVSGAASEVGSVDLGLNLPDGADWNADPSDANYCDSDGYEHCNGAKFWVVPSADYDGTAVINWNPESFLFETDLGIYFDCDLGVPYYLTYMGFTEDITAGTTLDSGEEQDFLICHDFVQNILPGTYEIETRII